MYNVSYTGKIILVSKSDPIGITFFQNLSLEIAEQRAGILSEAWGVRIQVDK